MLGQGGINTIAYGAYVALATILVGNSQLPTSTPPTRTKVDFIVGKWGGVWGVGLVEDRFRVVEYRW